MYNNNNNYIIIIIIIIIININNNNNSINNVLKKFELKMKLPKSFLLHQRFDIVDTPGICKALNSIEFQIEI
jgi:hypothetical protein